MELQILVSKKGTKVVTATNLYLALQLPSSQYRSKVKKWLSDVYEFKDGIHKPEKLKDYSLRKVDGAIISDYYLSVELAKMITLNSQSKVKQKFAKWLLSLEEKVENAELLTKDQVLAVLELSKVMGLMSCQEAAEKQHFQQFEKGNDSKATWWKHRNKALGYTLGKLKNRMNEMGKAFEGKTKSQMLMQIDKYEMVRTAVIDTFMGLGKSEQYAKNLGDLAKVFAKELNVEIWDDRKSPALFSGTLNHELIQEVKASEKSGFLGLW